MKMSIENSVQRAASLLETENFSEAEKICTEILNRAPENREAKYLLGLLLASVSGADEAFAYMKSTMEQYPHEDGLLIGFVEILLASGALNPAQTLVNYARDAGMVGEGLDRTESAVLMALISNDFTGDNGAPEGSEHSLTPEMEATDTDVTHQPSPVPLALDKVTSSMASSSGAVKIESWARASQDELDNLMALLDGENYSEAERAAQDLSRANPNDAVVQKVLGLSLQRLAMHDDALKAFQRSISLNNVDPEAHNNLANVLCQMHRLNEAKVSFERAIECGSIDPLAYNTLGLIYQSQKRVKEARGYFERAISIRPEYPDAICNLGIVLLLDGQMAEAERQFRHALAYKPDLVLAHCNLGVLLKKQGRIQEAQASLLVAVALDPNNAEAQSNLGVVLVDLGRCEEAEKHFRDAIKISPNKASAHCNLGDLLRHCGRLREAIESLRLAIHYDPAHSEAHNNLCISLREIGNLEQALASGLLAVEHDPKNAVAFNNIGGVLLEMGRLDEAEGYYFKAISLDPGLALAEGQWMHQRQHMSDFEVSDLLSSACSRLGVVTASIPPFLALSWADNPEQHLLRARAYCNEEYKAAPQSLPVKPAVPPPRLKIGYFSADFHDFPGMYLMAGLLESHDRERFEVYAFSYGPDRDDAMRRRIVAAVDHFIDIREMSTQEAVDLSRKHGIDIALHRNGHTKGSRTELFQHRLAPVQVSYLGYPGTLGADFIDYLVADPVVIPEKERQHYCEKIIYLPDTYQPNDNTRHIAETSTTRADFNLPEDAFVFCCFNHNYKISPREFDIWMRVLGNVEGSVLWLLNSNVWAVMNLKKEAERRGIDPSRLIFAEKIPHAEHLARHKHADLFVDTFNYNAHTTASDALWAGLPVVTKQGRQFAARVAASLLTAVGLPELITESEEDYERLILNLAQDRQQLSAIKATLEENRRTEPLFDTQRYTRNLETGFLQAYDAYHENNEMSEIRV